MGQQETSQRHEEELVRSGESRGDPCVPLGGLSTPPPLHTGQLSLKVAQEVGLNIPIHLLPLSKGPLTKVSSTASRIPGAEHCFCQI